MALTTIIPQSTVTHKKPQVTSHTLNGFTVGVNSVQFPLQTDVPLQPIYTFKVVPAVVAAACIAPSFAFSGTIPGGGWVLPLVTTIQGTAPNITATPLNFLGTPGVFLDCERAVKFYYSGTVTTTHTITVTGYDYLGTALNQAITVTTGTTANTTACFAIVTSIVFSTNPGSGVSVTVGTSGIIGLPYFLSTAQFVTYSSWNGTTLAAGSGTVNVGYNWRQNGGQSTTTIARGSVNTGTNAPDGTRMLVISYYVYGADSEANAEVQNLNQSSLKIYNFKKNATSEYPAPIFATPYFTKYDLTGVQFVGDAAFITAYQAELAK